MRTVAIVALKGGSGKTTVATHLALAAHLRGRDVLVVDLDPQHSVQDVLGAREEPGPPVIASTGPKLLSAQFAAAGLKKDILIVDTPAGAIEDVGEALVLCDLAVMVVRPTMLDLAGLVRTLTLVRKLRKPAVVVMNQAPVARENNEAPVVKRMLRGLAYMQAPMAPVVLRARSVYQTALERGRSAEETPDKAAAGEIAALWEFIDEELAAAAEEAEAAEQAAAEA